MYYTGNVTCFCFTCRIIGGKIVRDFIVEIEEQLVLSENEKKVDLLNTYSKEIVLSNPRKALALSEEAYRLSLELGYTNGIAWSLLNMGYAGRSLSNYAEYLPKLSEALDLFISLENKEGQMRVLNLMGVSYFHFGKYEQALDFFRRSLALANYLQDMKLQSSLLNNIGEIYRELEKYEDALDYYLKALKASEGINEDRNSAVILMNIGHIHNKQKRSKEAMDYYDKCIAISEKIGDSISKGEALNKKGELFEEMNDTDEALKLYEESLNILKKCENRFYQIDALLNLGNHYIKRDKSLAGMKHIERALALAREISANKKLYCAHRALAECYERQGDFRSAFEHYKMYHDIEKQVTNENIEEKLKIIAVEYRLEQARKEAEIFHLKNIELKEKNEEIENKARLLAIANEKLEYLSSIDELTGIPNRRIFNRVIKKEWDSCMREELPLTVIIIDVDFFKDYNDNYGHLQGDECLKLVAGTLSKELKNTCDFIGRFGGEEFGIILSGTGYECGIMIAEQMRISIESLQIRHEYSSAAQHLTISIGIATVIPSKQLSYKDLINSADKELYKAKKNGRNMVCAVML